jgi:hypothetical protein
MYAEYVDLYLKPNNDATGLPYSSRLYKPSHPFSEKHLATSRQKLQKFGSENLPEKPFEFHLF